MFMALNLLILNILFIAGGGLTIRGTSSWSCTAGSSGIFHSGSAGIFDPETGATSSLFCKACPAGTFSADSATSATAHDDISDCLICAAGTF